MAKTNNKEFSEKMTKICKTDSYKELPQEERGNVVEAVKKSCQEEDG